MAEVLLAVLDLLRLRALVHELEHVPVREQLLIAPLVLRLQRAQAVRLLEQVRAALEPVALASLMPPT